MSCYDSRIWQGDPMNSEGITHAARIDIDGDFVAACGHFCNTISDYQVPSTNVVTCLRCWARLVER